MWNVDNFNTSVAGFSVQDFEYHMDDTKLPKVFPGQWVKSCVAFSIETGSIKWVVDGILVFDVISEALMKATDNIPSNFTGKIVIGAGKYASGCRAA